MVPGLGALRLRPLIPAAAGALVVAAAVAAVTHTIGLGLVLSPLAAVATGLAGRRLAGDRFGVVASWVYVALPALGLAYVFATYRHTFVHGSLPGLVGLRSPWWLAVGIVAAVAYALAPAAGLAAAGVVAAVAALAVCGTGGLSNVTGGLHETGWSPSFAEWVLVAGVVGAILRRPLLGVALGGWAVAGIVCAAHGGYGDAGQFWGLLAPAAPAAALVVSALALLVPRTRPSARPAPRAG